MVKKKAPPKRICPACNRPWADHRTSEVDVCLLGTSRGRNRPFTAGLDFNHNLHFTDARGLPPLQNPRLLWRPKLPEMPVQCVSCPFRTGNDVEFREVLTRLKNKGKKSGKLVVSMARAAIAREQLLEETAEIGDFSCHQSAFNPDMTTKPYLEHRQCPGASANFVKSGERKQQEFWAKALKAEARTYDKDPEEE